MWDPYAEIEKTTLPNGLDVLSLFIPERQWVKIGILVHSGGLCGSPGVAHFTEHMLTSKETRPVTEIFGTFNDVGGSVNLGRTNFFKTDFGFSIPLDKLEETLRLFHSYLLEPLSETTMEKERAIILREFAQVNSNPKRIELQQRTLRESFPGTFFEKNPHTLGTREAIEKISFPELCSFSEKHYVPANISIVCIGGIRFHELVNILTQTNWANPKAGDRNPLLPPVQPGKPLYSRRHISRDDFDLQKADGTEFQTGVAFAPTRVPAISSIAREILSNSLLEEFREKQQLVYSLAVERHNYIAFQQLVIILPNLPTDQLIKVEKTCENLLQNLANDVTTFAKGKSRRLAGFLISDQNATQILTSCMNDLENFQRIKTMQEELEEIESIQQEEVAQLLSLFLSDLKFVYIYE